MQVIGRDDYERVKREFDLWVRIEKKKLLDELSEDKLWKLFDKYNKKKLDQRYYSHPVLPMSQKAKEAIEALNERKLAKEKAKQIASRVSDLDWDEEQEKKAVDRYEEKLERKRFRKEQEVVLEELVPKKTGKEALLEKKKTLTAYHKQEREVDPAMKDSDIFGDDDFSNEILRQAAKEAQQKSKRMRIQKEKAEEMEQKKLERQKKEEQTIRMLKDIAARNFG
ncbi:hypothetical protein HK103_003169 [Boothiomyces macroporosus]|uniref:Uncharacterized protein n=1 Tax=Boothiomyces macroporosus TaxID=261099 RepID=A0AAD5Y4K0_9FUNG|nr:hypothetical protein HK103_003169 [Boothiomyces macroporosus]